MCMLFPSLLYLLVFDHVTCHRYTYSLVFASDMYATVFKQAPLDPKLGKLYRDKILLVCYDLISSFLFHIITVQNIPEPMTSQYVIPCIYLTVTSCIVVYK